MKALIGIIVFGVLCVPALIFGNRNIATTVFTLQQYPHLAAVQQTDSYGNVSYQVTGTLKQVVSTYHVSCGSALASHSPTPTLTSQQTTITHVDDSGLVADNAAAAISQDMSSNMPGWMGEDMESPSYFTLPVQMQAMPQFCKSHLTTDRVSTFMMSPIGWTAVILIIMLCLGVYSGSSGGGVIYGRGTSTPNLNGGMSWRFRFWR